MLRKAILTGMLLAAAVAGGCGGGGFSPGDDDLVVYSGREEELIGPLIERFEEQGDIDVAVRYANSAELAATLAEEGGNSPADVFWAQDPGSLGAVENEGLLARLPAEVLDRVPERLRDPDGRWVGISGRVRVIAYNTDKVNEADVPDTIDDVSDPRWRGKVGIAPPNASFQAFVSAMRLERGDDATRAWLDAVNENDPRFYENNIAILEALAEGEIELGLVNHYYLSLVKAENPDAPVANHFLRPGDVGALVSVAGAAVVDGTEKAEQAQEFVEFLLSQEGQRFYAEEAEEAEYPLIEGVEPREGLPPLDTLRGPDIPLDRLGSELESTLELLNDAGYTT
ncbi:MAG TPA: iron ABC transporter substrate-binding protein [Gaiellaceae bacterium]|nr:iron ABC transporter substrate-binding protein [Gaiellaceae bacterium]